MKILNAIRSLTIRTKLVILFSMLVGVISLFMYIYIPARLEKQSVGALADKTSIIARMTAFSMSSAVFFSDVQTLNEELQSKNLTRDVTYIVIHDESGKKVATYHDEEAEIAQYQTANNIAHIGRDTVIWKEATPILYDNKKIGVLYIGVLMNDVLTEVERSRNNIALLSGIVFVVGVLAVYGISSLITKPLRQIVKTIEGIASGDLTHRAEVVSQDEIGHVAASFNTMVENVQEAQSELENLNKTLETRVKERTVALTTEIQERKETEERLRESEERYRLLVELSPDAIVIHQNGKFVFSNVSGAVLFGVDTPEELIGKPILNFVHPQYRNVVIERVHRISNGEVAPMLEEKFIKFDGTEFDVEVAAIPSVFQGAPAVQVVIRDITQRKKSEEALRSSEIEMRALFSSMRDSIVVLDAQGRYVKVAPENRGFLPLPHDELIGKSLDETLPAEEAALLLANVGETLATKETRHVEYCMKINDNEIWFLGALSPMTENTVLWVARDITERKQAEKEYRDLEQKLLQSQKLESLGTLAGGIAHDFNNILAIILGYSNILRMRPPSQASLEQNLLSIDAAVNRGANLVKQILTFARKAEQVFGALDVNVSIKEHIRLLSETFPKTITITAELDASPSVITADPTQFHQTLLNLCVNARDAMPLGGTLMFKTNIVGMEHVRKRFSAASEREYLCMSIGDTGTGMNSETLKRVFDPFFTTKGVGKGTGLGLPVVYGIMQSHKGFIDVESELGKGTTFTLYFPLSKSFEEKQKSAQTIYSDLPGGKETVLLIEDEQAVRMIASTQLQLKGYTVIVAEDGEEALREYRNHSNKIDIVFSDMGLPKLSGEYVFYRIKELQPEIKFIFASGFIGPEKRAELFQAGVNDILHKPYQVASMLKSIRNTLDGINHVQE